MQIFKDKGSHTTYALTKKIVLIKNEKCHKVKFYFKGHGFANFRFNIRPCKNYQYFHWFIRLPFFLFEKDNGGYKIGNSSCYLWFIR